MGCTVSAATDELGERTTGAYSKYELGETIGTVSYARVHSKYEFGEKIGMGSFAQVYLAIKKHTNDVVAVKIRNLHPHPTMKLQLEEDVVLKSSIRELALWKAVGTHANCVQLLESFYDDSLVYMVMERCDCSLFNYLRRQKAVNETCLGKAFEQMLTGISHLHFVSVIHRDLKPDNFLARANTVKICDFGLSAMMPRSGMVDGMIGTAPYMPPEMLATKTYDQKADVWSFGVVAYLLLCGELPYETSDGTAKTMKKSILHGVEPHCGRRWLTTNAVTFLQQVLKRSPCQRPTATLALQLPFITRVVSPRRCLRFVLNSAHKTASFASKELLPVTRTDALLKRLRNEELEHKSFKTFDNAIAENVSAIPPLKAKTTIEMVELLDDTSSPMSESTGCGSACCSSAASSRLFL